MTILAIKTPAEVMGTREPVLFPGLAAAWPAVRRWTPDFLADLADDREVRVVIGDREGHAPRFQHVTLRTFFAVCFAAAPSERQALYLKEYDLLGALPTLAADLDLTALSFAGAATWRFAWIGQRGGRTGFHYDVFHNVLTQLVGTKQLVLIPPAASPGMYPSPKYDYGARLSRVDGFAPDLRRFPRYREALAQARHYTLQAGDALYIPRGWWHQAESLTPTISLSGFTARRWERLVYLNLEKLRKKAHELGLYRRGHCTCHAATA